MAKQVSLNSNPKRTPTNNEHIKPESLFTKDELQALNKIYKKLVQNNKIVSIHQGENQTKKSDYKYIKTQEGIEQVVFQELLHNTFDIVTEDTLSYRIFYVWDKNNNGILNKDTWIEGLAIFLKEKFIEKIKYCFKVYDLNSDGFITKDEVFHLLENCLIQLPQEEDAEEAIKDIVDTILKKLDVDKDGKISFEDYKTSVEKETLLLEAFGQCLPTERACITFLTTLSV